MKKKISSQDVKHVAKLANLTLTDNEIKKFTRQLSEVIDYSVSLLEKVNTKNIKPTAHIIGLKNVLRDDEVEPGLSQEDTLANTKEEYNGFFKVKSILDK